jgi:8-oxo-dGTP pyrophosphatase MutT (NUDIX family)
MQAVVREVLEETGLSVRPRWLLGVFGGEAFAVTYSNGDKVEYTAALFGCEVHSLGQATLDGETASLRFYEPRDVPALGTEYPRSLLYPDAQGLP